MRFTRDWTDYKLIDVSEKNRLEAWGDIILIRPDPQVVFTSPKNHPLWKNSHATYHRSKSGGGEWEIHKKVPESWQIRYHDLIFNLKPMGFKHTGIFPEQAVNWDLARSIIEQTKKVDITPLKILNLFAYTGAATLACAAENAEVVHVDASKGMVSWARDNAKLSGQANAPIRWIVDDCIKFVEREIRRGNVYDGIIMDPPSYGRGPGGEIWKLEEQIHRLIKSCACLLNENSKFFILNTYTTGLSPSVMEYMLGLEIESRLGGSVSSSEIGLPVETTGMVLPCGGTAVWRSGALV